MSRMSYKSFDSAFVIHSSLSSLGLYIYHTGPARQVRRR